MIRLGVAHLLLGGNVAWRRYALNSSEYPRRAANCVETPVSEMSRLKGRSHYSRTNRTRGKL